MSNDHAAFQRQLASDWAAWSDEYHPQWSSPDSTKIYADYLSEQGWPELSNLLRGECCISFGSYSPAEFAESNLPYNHVPGSLKIVDCSHNPKLGIIEIAAHHEPDVWIQIVYPIDKYPNVAVEVASRGSF